MVVCVIFNFIIYIYLKQKYFFAIVFLSLLPFIRQNLLIISLIIYFVIMFNIYKKSSNKNTIIYYTIIYFSILFLPIYHNLFYGGELKFFVSARPFNSEIFKSLFDLVNHLSVNHFNEIIILYRIF